MKMALETSNRLKPFPPKLIPITSGGLPRKGGGLISDTVRRIQRERDDADAMTTMERLIKVRGDLLFLTYCVQNGQYEGKPMMVKAAAANHYFVLSGIPTLFHSNASADQSQRSSLDSKFDPMLNELLPTTENGQVLTPPSGYYVVSPHHPSCSCPFVATQGPFRKVSSRCWCSAIECKHKHITF